MSAIMWRPGFASSLSSVHTAIPIAEGDASHS